MRDDVRRGASAVPGARADRVPQRGHLRPARAAGRGGDDGGDRPRPRRGPDRAAVLRGDDRRPPGAPRCVRGAGPRRTGAGGAHVVHERGMRDRAPRSRPRGGGRDRHDDRRALRPSRADRRVRRAVVVVPPTPDASSRPSRPDEAHRDLPGALDDRRRAPARGPSRANRRAGARGRRAVGRRDPATARGLDFSRSRARSGSAGRMRPVRSSSATPSGCRGARRVTSRRAAYEPDGCFEPQPTARRFDTGWWAPGVARAGCSPRSRCARTGARAGRGGGARCRALLAGRVELLRRRCRRRSSPSVRRRRRRRRSSVCMRPASTSGSSPGAESCGPRAAGGRATTISTGSSRRSARNGQLRPRRRRCGARAPARSAAAPR